MQKEFITFIDGKSSVTIDSQGVLQGIVSSVDGQTHNYITPTPVRIPKRAKDGLVNRVAYTGNGS